MYGLSTLQLMNLSPEDRKAYSDRLDKVRKEIAADRLKTIAKERAVKKAWLTSAAVAVLAIFTYVVAW